MLLDVSGNAVHVSGSHVTWQLAPALEGLPSSRHCHVSILLNPWEGEGGGGRPGKGEGGGGKGEGGGRGRERGEGGRMHNMLM